MELWQALLVAFGGNAAVLLILGFLGRSLINNALSKDLEKFKGQLQLAATEHEITFRRLHERRAEVVADLYRLLVEATWEAESFANPVEFTDEPDKKQKYIAAQNAIAAYFRFFDQHRIYLSPDLCNTLEKFAREIREPVLRFGMWVRYENPEGQTAILKNDAWDAAWKKTKEEIPKLREAIEKEFRVLLGSSASVA